MKGITQRLVETTLRKYGVPEWVDPYVHKYLKSNPVSVVKFATSFIDTKRKKGEVTKKYVRLPNGTTFGMDSIIHLLNLFYYGEDRMVGIYKDWSENSTEHNAEYSARFAAMMPLKAKHARAIKNMMEGLGKRPEAKEPKEIKEVFDYIGSLKAWNDRILATNVVLRGSYANVFGTIFFKVFYPVSPEFMRSLGKAFETDAIDNEWGFEEARKIIADGLVPEERILQLARELTARVLLSIEANMKFAKKAKIPKELELLRDIAVANPFHTLKELGLEIDVDKEVKMVASVAKGLSTQKKAAKR
ncbi:MAG TPA: hypothetical protein VND15_02565 [Candidatus Acidoferrales bacterium]|nr:hypothetical protein [Candidatus Acidoferrales bacterium]